MMLTQLYRRLSAAWRIHRDPVAYARWIGVRIGEGCRLVALTPGTFGSEPYLVQIGNRVTMAAGVRFITHDGGVAVLREEDPDIDIVAPVRVGDNVFLGTNALLMPGVTIGSNCVIGAGAVVTRDIPSGQVAVGVPARCVKSIEDYRLKILENAFRVRSKSNADKRRLWEGHFFGARTDLPKSGNPNPAPQPATSTDQGGKSHSAVAS